MKQSFIYLSLISSLSANAALAQHENSNQDYYLELGTGLSANRATLTEANVTSNKNSGVSSFSIGYIHKPQIRFDLNLTYIPQWTYHKSFVYKENTTTLTNTKISSLATTLNVYYDIPTAFSPHLTPYISGGIGVSNNKISDTNTYSSNTKVSTHSSNNSYTPTWNLGAGLNYALNERLSIGLGYKFSSLGKVKTKSGYEIISGAEVLSSKQIRFKNIYAQQFTINLRIKF